MHCDSRFQFFPWDAAFLVTFSIHTRCGSEYLNRTVKARDRVRDRVGEYTVLLIMVLYCGLLFTLAFCCRCLKFQSQRGRAVKIPFGLKVCRLRTWLYRRYAMNTVGDNVLRYYSYFLHLFGKI